MTTTNASPDNRSAQTHGVLARVVRRPDAPSQLEPITLREVGPDDVRVHIEVTGVCHSDLSLARGFLQQPMPAVVGHEASGRILEVGSAVSSGVEVGQRVLLLWNAPCGACVPCRRDEAHLCVDGPSRAGASYASTAAGEDVYPGLTVGTFAQETVVPARAVFPIPDDISFEDAALLGCAVVTGVGAVTHTTKVPAGSTVLVIGLGGVGLSAVQGARLVGASTIIAVDRNPDKADLALAAGATHFFTADDNLKNEVRSVAGKEGVDAAFDCVGRSTTIKDAWSLSRRGGSVTVVGIGSKDDAVIFNALELFHFARTLRGCFSGSVDPHRDLPVFFEWVRSGQLDLRQLVTAHGGLDAVENALDTQSRGEGARTLIYPHRPTVS